MTSDGDPLDRLNASERELLLLLGRGHTAKSIAALKDLTELAVNERFRSARRKTGIGSSREIARLLVAQENRDDFIGLAEPAAATSDLPRPDAPRRASFFRRWSLPMSAAALLIASAILAQQTATPPSIQGARTEPLPENAFVTEAQRQPDISALSAEARSGRLDPSWSEDAQARLTAAYHQEPGMASLRSLDVICSDVLCEVLGETAEGAAMEDVLGLIRHAESQTIVDAVEGLGVEREFSGVRTTNGNPLKGWIVAYWRRAG